jgi:hypothetical protein
MKTLIVSGIALQRTCLRATRPSCRAASSASWPMLGASWHFPMFLISSNALALPELVESLYSYMQGKGVEHLLAQVTEGGAHVHS